MAEGLGIERVVVERWRAVRGGTEARRGLRAVGSGGQVLIALELFDRPRDWIRLLGTCGVCSRCGPGGGSVPSASERGRMRGRDVASWSVLCRVLLVVGHGRDS